MCHLLQVDLTMKSRFRLFLVQCMMRRPAAGCPVDLCDLLQVDLTMKAEMVADIRNYDPGNPSSPTTWAWDSTQEQVSRD